ncbi:merozoite surface protein [Plasmodium reichenowi]|uniref:Merozoite surface protein n=1 Tax=Plasmodium reichenowi TaxID=5854 RepID=C5HEJ7_PLARE|nr:Pf10_0352-like merozoite surface protein [Plasmodium reichenowi]CDO64790.1 merozoite surface protein [Plasmodium reichenowi]
MNKFLNIIFYIFLILNFSFFQSNATSKENQKDEQKNLRNVSSINNKNIENKNDNIEAQYEASEHIEKQNDILNMYNDEKEKKNNNSLDTNITKNTVIDNSNEFQTSEDSNVYNKGIFVGTGIKLNDSQTTSDNYKNERYQIDDKKVKYGGWFDSIFSSFVNLLTPTNPIQNDGSTGGNVPPHSAPNVDRSETSTTSASVKVPEDEKLSSPPRPEGPRANNRNENNQNADPFNHYFAWEIGGGAPTYKPENNKNDNILLEQIKITSWDKEDIIKENEDTKLEIQETDVTDETDETEETEETEDNLDMENENEIVEDELQENEDNEDNVNLEDINKNIKNNIFEEQIKLDSTQDDKAQKLISNEYKKTEKKNSLEDHVNLLFNFLQTKNQLDPSLKDLENELIVFLNNY